MSTNGAKFDPSAPLEPLTNVEERIEKKMNETNSIKHSIKNLKEKITDFRDDNRESKKLKNYQV